MRAPITIITPANHFFIVQVSFSLFQSHPGIFTFALKVIVSSAYVVDTKDIRNVSSFDVGRDKKYGEKLIHIIPNKRDRKSFIKKY